MIFKTIGFSLKLYIKTQPVFCLLIILLGIPHGLLHACSTLVFSRLFFDAVGDVINKGEPLTKACVIIAIAGLVFVVREIIEGVFNFLFSTVLPAKPKLELMRTLHEKAARIDPVRFEDAKLYDGITKAETGVSSVCGIVSYVVVLVAIYVPYFIFMSFYLHELQPRLIWVVVLAFVPSIIGQAVKIGMTAKFEDKAAPIKREYNYYRQTIADKTYYKETRKLGAYKFFLVRVLGSLTRLGKAEWSRSARINLIELSTNLVTAGGYAGVLYLLVDALLAGDISAGAFAAVFASIGKLFEWIRDLINESVGDLAVDLGKADNFIKFMELPERGGSDASPDFSGGIVAEDVSFAYPNVESASVCGVSLEIKAGETIAIVGENGAGKSTLVRFLTGLYTPALGQVNLNGMDTSEVCGASLFGGVSGVFQQFQRYQMSLDANVRISDFSSGEADKVTAVLSESGVDFTNAGTFPNGLGTVLSREFDGVDLSGGQWQRLAIARGLYRAHDVIVLDEPTAAIDPLEESRIYNKFVEISRGKTAIIVTHRLGSAKIADRVVVMDGGEILDVGSHAELMQRGGKYAEMFASQAGWYR